MQRMINGKLVEMAADEIAQMERENAKSQAIERSRPLTETEVFRMLLSAQVNAIPVDDNTALRMLAFYPEWAADTTYTAGFKVRRSGKLWRCVQAHTAQTGWEPESAAALWETINETHAGTQADPIPYEGNMALTQGLYYAQNYTIYRCTRDTEIPVYNPLAELVGVYVETV